MRASHGVFAAGDDRAIPIPRLLFAFVGSPVLWALHLGVVYFVVTMDCISTWDGGTWAVVVATVLFGAGCAMAGWTGWRLWRSLGPHAPDPEARDWTRFMLVAGMGGSALFGVAIVLEGVAPFLVALCA